MIKKMTSKLTDERNHFKPFNYPWAYDTWLKHEQSHWLHTEVPMAEDVKDWKKKLSNEEKHIIGFNPHWNNFTTCKECKQQFFYNMLSDLRLRIWSGKILLFSVFLEFYS